MAIDTGWIEGYVDVIDMYLPDEGEGETYATQIVTAVNKLVYKFYNDGDVFDNTYHLIGWANDLSSYANWLRKYTHTREILDSIEDCYEEDDYETLLKELCEALLIPEMLEGANRCHKLGSIYKEEGPFSFEDIEEEEEVWKDEYEDEWEEDFGEEV